MVKPRSKTLPWRDRVLRLERVRAGDLVAHSQNWRRHPPYQVEALKGVLSEVGFAGALLAYQDNGKLTLVDGHLRAGLDPNAEVPVLVLDVDAAEAKKFLATYDPLGAMAAPDQDALLKLLEAEQFQSQAVNAMLEALANGSYQALMPMPNMEEQVGLTEEDEVPLESAEPYVKRGDIWLCGEHRIMCGDSTKAEDAVVLFGGTDINTLFTDPPYGIDYSGGRTQVVRHKPYGRIARDSEKDNGHFVVSALAIPARDYWVCASPVNLLPILAAFNGVVDAVVVWDKGRPGLGYQWVRRQCEFIVFHTLREKTREETSEFDLWAIPTDKPDTYLHGTQKPVALVERALKFSGGLVVADPFLGSGSTLIACEKLGRICYGMEIESPYVQIAIERWQNYTGRKAIKVQDGDSDSA